MKIKNIRIQDYGPIRDLTLSPENFELIFGMNESGKTAIVEALSYVLFKRNPIVLRYGKPENTEIEIEKNGHVFILPAKKVNLELPHADIANLLYVQASEASVYGSKGETSFWDGIKSMFTKIGEGITFAKLDEKIFKAVGLTPAKSEWRDDKRRLIEGEENRKSELGAYLKQIGEIEKKETEHANLTEQNEALKNDLAQMETYKAFKNYQELSNLYNGYLEKKTHLQEYERYKYDYLTEWQELEAKKKSRLGDEKKLKEVKGEIVELEKEVMELRRKEEIIELENFKSWVTKDQAEVKESSVAYPFLILSASAILLILSFFLPIATVSAAMAFAINLVLFIIYAYGKREAKIKLAEKNGKLRKAKHLFPDIDDFSKLAAKIEILENNKLKKETLLDEKRKLKEHLSGGETADKIEKAISELRNRTGLAELSDLREKLDEKRKTGTEQSRLCGRISGMLSERNDRKWERMIRKMKTVPPEKEPDLASEKDLKHKTEKMRERIDELTREINVFRQVQQTRFNISDDRAAFIEYDRIQRELKECELGKKAALTAREILKTMSNELDESIHHIIKGNESLSEYFELVTDRYEEVEVKNENFIVKDKSGKQFKIGALSSGTQDQLLLCFRMAALKKIYPEGTFLILDDAFIFADWTRRRKLVVLLKKFAEDGNQVIYLTSDEHTRDLLAESGARVTVL